ncbi:MAG: 50S ribosomal protein L15 [Patescibacteria group bacterium]
MAITLHNIGPSKGSKKSKKRIGRGLGSKGTTAGRGQKGQKSRSGVSGLKRLGMKKIMLSMPKLRGFKSSKPEADVVSIESLAKNFGQNEVVSLKSLKEKRLIPSSSIKAKILGDGEIEVALQIKGCAVSKSAAEKILRAKGKIDA